MKICFSWDDGAVEDEKLISLHEHFSIPATFFIPTYNREGRAVISSDIIKKTESEIIRFGGHTANHTYLTDIPFSEVENEIVSNKSYLEDLLGHEISDFCFPGGRYNEKILQKVYEYYKTARSADTMNFSYNEGIFKPTFHFYPRGLKSLLGNGIRNMNIRETLFVLMKYKNDYFEMIKKFLDFENNESEKIIAIWGHSWELEKFDLWDKLIDLMKYTKKFECVPYSEVFYAEKKK